MAENEDKTVIDGTNGGDSFEDIPDGVLGDNGEFLPEMYKNEDFDQAGELDTDSFDDILSAEDTDSGDTGPTKAEQSVGTDEPVGGETTPGENPDGGDHSERKPRVLKLKVNHEESDLDVDAMPDDELTALIQKGKAFDQMKGRYDSLRSEKRQGTYDRVYNEQIEAGMSEDVAKMVASNVANQEYPENEVVTPSEPETNDIPSGRDFGAEYQQLHDLYPSLKDVPGEVLNTAIRSGNSLVACYQAYRDTQRENAAEKLRKENSVLRQNAASAARAPVTGVSGAGSTRERKKDPFEEGFDSDDWG